MTDLLAWVLTDTAPDPFMANLALAELLLDEPDLEAVTLERDQLAEQVRAALRPGMPALLCIRELNRVFFEEAGYRGAVDDYYDARNSLLPGVVERKRGIPLALANLYIAIGRSAGLPLDGVGFPGHFLIRYADDDEEYFIDPYGGDTLYDPELRALLMGTFGHEMPLEAEYLRPQPPQRMLIRMLTNLKGDYLRVRDYPRALLVTTILARLEPDDPWQARDLGMILEALDDRDGAITAYQRCLKLESEPELADQVLERIHQLQSTFE